MGLACLYDLPEDGYYYYYYYLSNYIGRFQFSLLRTEERMEYYSHEILPKEELEGNEK
jgi:hypothetical protein